MAMPMRRGDGITEEVRSRPERYRTGPEELQGNEGVVGGGEGGGGERRGERRVGVVMR